MRQPLIRFWLLCTLIFACGPFLSAQESTPYHYSIHKTAAVTHGAVVSAHPLASGAGLAILRQGGNAFDAAITTQLVLAVVYPAAGNIGGGGFMVAHLSSLA
ncbi:MAG TPA: gamma-glutamyltransferase, partial [Puia sp.]|nr:gamma-glutamyltransferase [Puia sp.]